MKDKKRLMFLEALSLLIMYGFGIWVGNEVSTAETFPTFLITGILVLVFLVIYFLLEEKKENK